MQGVSNTVRYICWVDVLADVCEGYDSPQSSGVLDRVWCKIDSRFTDVIYVYVS